MARTSPWPTILGTAALVALPVLAAAQSGQASGAGSQAPQSPKAQSDTSYPVGSGAATQHLTEAKQVLDGIPRNAVSGRNASKLNQIRREFAALRSAYSANPSPASTAKSSPSREAKSGAGHWNTQLMALDRDLTALLGSSTDTASTGTSSTGSTSTETTGTSGSATSHPSAGNSASAASLDPDVRSQLEEFRKHITEFAAAATGTQAGGEANSASSSGSMSSTSETASTPGSTTPTEPTETSQSASSSSPSNPGSSSSTQTGSATGETAQAQEGQTTGTSGAQADANAARQHLTEARQSLADLTALPQAQQLQGDTRTQVSQLISQFNQLITTQDDWRSSYEQVNATLTTLLNSSSASSASTETSSSSTTQGAVGTSGSATLDPAIRTKLEEFRTHLQAFFDSAGGSATAASSSTGSMGSTGSSTATTGYTGSTAGSTGASAEAESHIQAIERILEQASGGSGSGAAGSTGTSGTPGSTAGSAASGSSVTLTQQQIDQIRMHLQQLRDTIKK